MKNWSFDFANRQDLANYAEASQKGQIGVTLNSAWVVPLVQSKEDREAAYRGLAFMYDWLLAFLMDALTLRVVLARRCTHQTGRNISGLHEADPNPKSLRHYDPIYLMDGIKQIHEANIRTAS
ncbi:hypothetical protein JHK87_009478 [Glycine soja]|nr:hypothetical protein JHK87_009478 [Glycine soja]